MAARAVQLGGRACRVFRASYGHTRRIALPLYSLADGEPAAVATVNLPELALAADEVLRTTARTPACSPPASPRASSARPWARSRCAT